MLYLHGETPKCTFVSTLLEAVLLHVYKEMVDGAEVAVSSLSSQPPHPRAGQLQVGGGGHAAAGHAQGGGDQTRVGGDTTQGTTNKGY